MIQINTKSSKKAYREATCDFFPTPLTVVENILDNVPLKQYWKIFDPCAGNGNILKVLKKRGFNNLLANEIRDIEAPGLCDMIEKENVTISNYLATSQQFHSDVILTNPPFCKCLEFCEAAIKSDAKVIIMLMRLNFLACQKRKSFHENFPITKLFPLSKRPSFLENGKTDATEYAWFMWVKNVNIPPMRYEVI